MRMATTKPSASSVFVPSTFVINGAQFLNATRVATLHATIVISPLTTMQASL